MHMILLLLACIDGGARRAKPADVPSPPAPAAAPAPAQATAPPAPQPTTQPATPLSPYARLEDERNTIDVFKAAAPATVFVTQNQLVMDRYRMRASEVPAGTGSGFIWDTDGHIVTNFHVVDNARSLSVTLYDQSEWPATFIGGDPRKDIAVLKIEVPPDRIVPIRRAPPGAELEVGQKTLAIGNPFGLDHTLTVGIISALGREVQGYGGLTIRGVIQTDASINPGNSGGPLLDSQGQLIGMNTMIYSPSGSSAGIGFAVPGTIIERTVNQIVRTGKVQQVGIGVSIADDRIAQRARIDGVVIIDVQAGSPAERAGMSGLKQVGRQIVVGDVIIAVDGAPVHRYDDLYNALDPHNPGDKVKLKLRNGEAEREVEIEVVAVSGAE